MPPDRTKPADYHFHTFDFEGSKPYTLSAAQPKRGGLQFYSLVQDLTDLAATGKTNGVPNVQLAKIGAKTINPSRAQRSTYVLSFGGTPSSPGILFTGGVHAREWIAPEMTYLLAEYLIKNYSSNPVGKFQSLLSGLIETRRIYIVPMVNPEGVFYSVFGLDQDARMWRKNRRPLPTTADGWHRELADQALAMNPPFRNFVDLTSSQQAVTYEAPIYKRVNVFDKVTINLRRTIGIDLNRNLPTAFWGYETGANQEGQPTTESYFGPKGSSEVETQNLLQLLGQVQNAVGKGIPAIAHAIDYHSYGQKILYPDEAIASGQVNAPYKNIAKAIRRFITTTFQWGDAEYDYQLGDAVVLGYSSLGTLDSGIATLYNARAITVELDPKDDNPGFSLPEGDIMKVFEKNIRAALACIAGAGEDVKLRQTGRQGEVPFKSTVAHFLKWDVFARGNALPV